MKRESIIPLNLFFFKKKKDHLICNNKTIIKDFNL